jgi:hypothetical protein
VAVFINLQINFVTELAGMYIGCVLFTIQVRNISNWYQKTWRLWFELQRKVQSKWTLTFSTFKGKGL